MRLIRYFALLALLAACIACGSAPNKEVETLATEYVSALFAKDTDKVMKMIYLPEQINVLVSDQMIKNMLSELIRQVPDEPLKDLKFKALNSRLDGNKAEVTVQISGNGRVQDEKISLVNIDGWKVVPSF